MADKKSKSDPREIELTYKDDALEIIDKINKALATEGLHFVYNNGEDGVVRYTLKTRPRS